MNPHELTFLLKKEAARLGFDLAGATKAEKPEGHRHFMRWLAAGYAGDMDYLQRDVEARCHPKFVLEEAHSILMLAVNYRTDEPAKPTVGQGGVSRYAWGTDYHEVLRSNLRQLVDYHLRIVPSAQVRAVVDTAPLLEREYAVRAGLGWVGKNTCVVNEKFGSWIFLAALLTSEELLYDRPVKNQCGTCRACLEACPNGALVEPYQLDARRCISYLTIEYRQAFPLKSRKKIGTQLFGCDACQEACPHNNSTPITTQSKFSPRLGMNPLDSNVLFDLDESAFRTQFRDTPLWRTRRERMLRNAAIILGNWGDAAAVSELRKGLNESEPIVREACVWALAQMGCKESWALLRQQLDREEHPEVRAELQRFFSHQG